MTKASNGMIELVFMIVFMVAAVPLLITLLRVQNAESMQYFQDKSTYEKPDIIGYTGGVPSYIDLSAGIPLEYSAAVFIPLIQDKYCPEEARSISYFYDYDTKYSHRLNGTSQWVNHLDVNVDDMWRSKRTGVFSTVINSSYYGVTEGNLNQYVKMISYDPTIVSTKPSNAVWYKEYHYLKDGNPDLTGAQQHQLYIVWLKEQKRWAIVNTKTFEIDI